jgi:uncharacterized membrane protein
MNLPDPLHPALVHFPIVLILVGTLLALTSVFKPAWIVPHFTAIILGLGALGAMAAAWSGEEDEERAEKSGEAAEQVFERHVEWGERSRNAAMLGALAATFAALSRKRSSRVSNGAMIATAAISLASSWCVIEAGHYGGQLVYRHGVGVNLPGQTGTANIDARKQSGQRDDD